MNPEEQPVNNKGHREEQASRWVCLWLIAYLLVCGLEAGIFAPLTFWQLIVRLATWPYSLGFCIGWLLSH